MISRLARWRRPASKASHLRITVYTRSQCCCCHKALDLLKGYQRLHRFVIDEVDIDADTELTELYGTTVPVVAVDGKVRFKGAVNPALLERLLLAEGRGR
jgi:glutaredoxin